MHHGSESGFTSAVPHHHRRKKSKDRQGLSGKKRLRALIRRVIHNRPWLQETHISRNVDDDVKKNVLMIETVTREKYQSLTIASKALLRKDLRLRTEEDTEHLYRVIGNLKCFRRYPESVRKELVASSYFEYYDAKRVIVRQGQESSFMGFILRGEMEVKVTKMDPVFGKLVTESVGHLLAGAVFGDVALLHNIPRTATIISLTAVELLILKKDDFERVLKARMQKQMDEIRLALKQFPYFNNWNNVAIRECCMLSDTASFIAQDIILGKGVGKHTSTYFMLSGTCSMVQQLIVTKEVTGFKLHSKNYAGPKAQSIYVQACLFTKGACFNIGESLKNRTVVAETEVSVLRIPLFLLHQHNVANSWSRIKYFLESRLPSDDELFFRFLEKKSWTKYKKDLFNSLRNVNTLNNTSIHDTPYYWRVLDIDPRQLEKKINKKQPK